MHKVGITIGKFMPFHLGHKHMIDTALDSLDQLIVLVSGSERDEIPLSVRYNNVVDTFRGRLGIQIVKHYDRSPKPVLIDEHGTVLDKEFQEYWINEFKPYNATHFVSSDWYGKTMAEKLGIRWFPVDPDRELYPISGTAIRANFAKHFDMLTDVVKPRYVKRVALVGPESCGKSTMTKMLAKEFNGIAIPEYGRLVSEVKNNNLDLEDFYDIVWAQSSMVERAALSNRYPIVFTDTEAYTTYLYSKVYLNVPMPDHFYDLGHEQNFDLYILLAPTVKWVDDGTRVMPDTAERFKFFYRFKDYLDLHDCNYVVIDDDNYEDRWKNAKLSIKLAFSLTD